MTRAKSLGEHFSEIALAHGDKAAIAFPERIFTFSQLMQMVESFAFKFRETGCDQSVGVQLLASDHLVQLAGVLATSMVGAKLVLDPRLPKDGGETRRFVDNLEGPWACEGAVLIDGTWSPSAVLPTVGPAPVPKDRPPVGGPWLTVTAMREDGPLAVHLSEAAIMARIGDVGRGFDAESRVCSLSPLISLTFLTRSLAALFRSGTVVVGHDPMFWERAGVTRVSGRPGDLTPLIDQMRFQNRLPVVEIVGARPTDKLARHLLEHFEVVEDAFGTVETGVVHVNTGKLNRDGQAEWQSNPQTSGVRIVDTAGKAMAKGGVGLIQIRASAPLDQAVPEVAASLVRWMPTNDLARWGETGDLVVVGRSDDLINVLGRQVPGLAIDQIVTSVAGILRAACFKNPVPGAEDELFIYCVFDEGCNQMQAIASAKYKIGKSFGPAFVPRVFRQVAGIPMRPDGRAPDRRGCAEFLMEIYRQRLRDAAAPQGGDSA